MYLDLWVPTVLPLVQSRIKYTGVHFGWMVLYDKTSQNALFKKKKYFWQQLLLKQV